MNSLTFQHAETHTHYLPESPDPRVAETRLLLDEVNKIKVQTPEKGVNIYDSLIDKIVTNTRMMTTQPGLLQEPVEWTPAQRVVWRSSTLPADQRLAVIDSTAIAADVSALSSANSGRWIVTCPFPGCNGAQYASITDQRFWCVDCSNMAVSQQWIAVIWPDNANEIERVLSNRPRSAQNWIPGETIEMLETQIDLGHQ